MTDYKKYEGKKVKLTRTEAGKTDTVEIEGTVQSGNALGVLIRPKGKTQFELIPAVEIEEINYVEDKAKDLTVKTLKVITFGQGRAHLLERHNYTLTDVNKLTELEGYDLHNLIDHVSENLGHIHGDKTATPRVEAVEAATATA